MTSRLKVYIAGPISSGDLDANIRQATEAARELIRHGFAPLCPQLTCYLDGSTPSVTGGVDHETWMAVDLPWVAAADVVLRLPGESAGADREVAEAERLGIPVRYATPRCIGYTVRVMKLLQELGILATRSSVAPTPQPLAGSPAFHAVLASLAELHSRKAKDYGDDSDPFANVRGSQAAGVEPWRGVWVRCLDKVHRINRYCQVASLANEGVEDSFLDLASYCIIALILHREVTDAGE